MKQVLILTKSPSLWDSLLNEYFSEVEVNRISSQEGAAIQKVDLIFVEAALITMPVLQKIRLAKAVNSTMRVFCLGDAPKESVSIFDAAFADACGLFDFSKKISEKIPFPDSIKLLVTDDDPEILAMVADYFEGRQAPAFEVARATNGREAWEMIQKNKPNVMILDMKMPIMKGSELYAKLQKENNKIPTVIFFDAISAGDLDLVKKSGRPIIVEKGYRESSMPYLMTLVKKLIYFSA